MILSGTHCWSVVELSRADLWWICWKAWFCRATRLSSSLTAYWSFFCSWDTCSFSWDSFCSRDWQRFCKYTTNTTDPDSKSFHAFITSIPQHLSFPAAVVGTGCAVGPLYWCTSPLGLELWPSPHPEYPPAQQPSETDGQLASDAAALPLWKWYRHLYESFCTSYLLALDVLWNERGTRLSCQRISSHLPLILHYITLQQMGSTAALEGFTLLSVCWQKRHVQETSLERPRVLNNSNIKESFEYLCWNSNKGMKQNEKLQYILHKVNSLLLRPLGFFFTIKQIYLWNSNYRNT